MSGVFQLVARLHNQQGFLRVPAGDGGGGDVSRSGHCARVVTVAFTVNETLILADENAAQGQRPDLRGRP